jgi:hypothetical protein
MAHWSEVADAWPEVAYSGPVVGKQDPWDVNDNVMVPGTAAPPNPEDIDANIMRHGAHTDENSSTAYDARGQHDNSQGMNTILDGTYQHPSAVQPGIGGTLNQPHQTDMLANSNADQLDNWPHMLDLIGKQSDAIDVRLAPNRDCLLMTVFVPAAAGGANGIEQLVARDPRRQKLLITNVGAAIVALGSHEGDVQNIPTGAALAGGTVYYLTPNAQVTVYYDGDMWVANSQATSAYVSVLIERDR